MVEPAIAVSKSPLLVFSDDWGRHPSSCQHLVRQLLANRNAHWVNTIGMRPPRFDAATLRRGIQKLSDWSRRSADSGPEVPSGLTVHNPKMWPWVRRSFDRRFNRSLLLAQLRRVTAQCSRPPIAITTLPIVADLMGRLPVARWIYYCVDDFSEWPGLDRGPLEFMERKVVRRADALISVSEKLQQRLAHWGRSSGLLTHGVELEHWNATHGQPMLEWTAALERPLLVYWGLIDARMDAGIIVRTAADMSKGTLLLVGPQQNPDPAVYAHPRVRRMPALDYHDLPRLAFAADLLIMPYADLPVTRAMQPLKLKEYLATGKPVVSRDLPAVREWADCLDLAPDAESFSATVQRRLSTGATASQLASRRRLSRESWRAKAAAFEQWLQPDEDVRSDAESEWSDADWSNCPS